MVKLRCNVCNSPRKKAPCHKCGGPLTEPSEGWIETRTPPIKRIRNLAKEVGYAIGVHGSLERDLDLIAAPWVAEAIAPEALCEHIAAGLKGTVLARAEERVHGRYSVNIQMPGWYKLIDLSVMPPLPQPL